MTYTPNARPGSRAPHLWLPDGRSTVDLFLGRQFTLARIGPDAPRPAALGAAARERGVLLQTVDLAGADALRLYLNRLVLVRPDGHVAWRGDLPAPDAGEVIDVVRGARCRQVRPAAPEVYGSVPPTLARA